MKYLLLAPLLLASCAAPSASPDGGSSSASATDREREDMERKLIGFQEKFDRFDDNGDGFLTTGEVSTGIIVEQVAGLTPADTPKIFRYYDRNGDGRISLAEANAGYERGPDAALRAEQKPL